MTALLLPHLRHGAGTKNHFRYGRSNPELEDMTRRLWVGVILTVPLLAIAMSDLIPGQPLENVLSMKTAGWIEMALATPVVVWGGAPFFARAWQSVVTRNLNMFTLIGWASALLRYRVVATALPQAFPASFREMAPCPFISKRRRRSLPWCCWARFWN